MKGNLAIKENVKGTRYYQTIPLYDSVDESLDKIAAANEHWSTIPSNCPVYVDTSDYTEYLNDLSVPCVTESKYWDGFFTLNNPDLRTPLVLHQASKFCINTSNMQDAMHPIRPCITRLSDIDHKSKRPFFGWLSFKTVKCTFDHCTQHMRLPPLTHLQKRFKSPNLDANIFYHQ